MNTGDIILGFWSIIWSMWSWVVEAPWWIGVPIIVILVGIYDCGNKIKEKKNETVGR